MTKTDTNPANWRKSALEPSDASTEKPVVEIDEFQIDLLRLLKRCGAQAERTVVKFPPLKEAQS
ncbi:hypothetical protein [Rhizobium leguminosarum]|uniref:hypothetical protein n=1 Tax=Rhizobium leguminosarum TaxID=384 RepID=UPI001F3D4575|nr:hypothetical protein [Rhizobium leguminosarum]UIK19362.1 hypothetical protein LZK79_10240 [Rhizobium leguminosarum]